MEKIDEFVVKSNDDLYKVFDAADENNDSIDSMVENYLDENADGISFSYDNRELILSKDSKTGKYTLHEQIDGALVLKDPDVQMNTKWTPDGYVEIGGLSPVGTRIFMGRSPDNEEQIIAFVDDHSISSVKSKPENAVVLFDGSENNQAEESGSANNSENSSDLDDTNNEIDMESPPVATPVEADDVDATSEVNSDSSEVMPPNIIFASDLPDGRYEIKEDGLWYNSEGDSLGISTCPPGIYQVQSGELLRKLPGTGDVESFVPANQYTGLFTMGASFTNSSGELIEASFEFLTQIGIGIEQIDIPLINPNYDTSQINGSFTVEMRQDKKFVINGDGKVVGAPYLLNPGNYRVEEIDGERITYHEVTVNGSNSVFIPVDVFNGQYKIDNQPILDQNGKVMRQQDGSLIESSFEQLVDKFGLSVSDISLRYLYIPSLSDESYRIEQRDGISLVIDIATDKVVGRSSS